MELLTPNEINRQKTLERQVEITEGAKLATRVDALRHLTIEEEGKLKTFRDETMGQIQVEIDGKINEHALLSNEVEGLKIQRERLMQPLDNEWQTVNAKRASVEESLLLIENKIAELQQREQDALIREREVAVQESRQADVRSQLQDVVDKANARFLEANDFAEKLNNQKIEQDAAYEQRTKDLDDREAQVAYREIDVLNMKNNNEAKSQELLEKERFINDKYDTLQRAVAHNQ